MKKFILLFLAFLVFEKSGAIADECSTAPEKELASCTEEFSFCTEEYPFCDSGEFFAGIDYLYWNALQSNMTFATIVDDIATFSNPRIVGQKQDWNSGFRLTAGYYLPCEFDTTFSWTRFFNNVTGSVNDPIIVATQILGPVSGFAIGGAGIGGPSTSTWNLRLNLYDWNFGAIAFENETVLLHPYVGLKGGSINQNQLTTYENFLDTNTGLVLNATVNQRNHLWLVGTKIGCDGAYNFGSGFSLIADFAGAFLYGQLRSTAATEVLEPPTVPFDSILRNTRRRLMPWFQTFIGFNWETCWQDCYQISLGVGYEMQYFFHTWRIVNSSIQNFYITNAGFGDLMLHGLTANLSMRF